MASIGLRDIKHYNGTLHLNGSLKEKEREKTLFTWTFSSTDLYQHFVKVFEGALSQKGTFLSPDLT